MHYWQRAIWLAVVSLLLVSSCKPLKRVYVRAMHPHQSTTQTATTATHLLHADVLGGTELDTGRFQVLNYTSKSFTVSTRYRQHVGFREYQQTIFLRCAQLKSLPVGQIMSVPNASFTVAGYDSNTLYSNISGTVIRLDSSTIQPRFQFDLRYLDKYKLPSTILKATVSFQRDSTYFERTNQDYQGRYNNLRLALKESGRVKLLDLNSYAHRYRKFNGEDSYDTLYARLGELYNLEELSLEASYLPVLPPGFTKLKRLKKLNLSYNRLTQFPTELYQLDSLEELNLERNWLDSIPPSIRQMERLRVLNLSSNQLTRYPEAVNALANLRELHLGNANIRRLPLSTRQLRNLEVMDVGNQRNERANKVHNVDALTVLPHLRRVSLEYNPLDSLPAAVYQLQKLQELNIKGTGLDTLSVNLRRLPSLRKLELYYEPQLFPSSTQP
ncbi:leucine-rich repeat domain-containing protein [Hymenobacter endophyticus]|uniref:Leucine-rich repeat domain-containing protein n=1 Tax=Hymenobacter endophyticus TaxID=3076335 RepID=A0ABU3TES4_9BACT|nr:leucine-rich repeat domain-containing protein [Hymenobacter endophyticus]MDU0369877.1 leucine-rich repeat domain-containing protein [Hymenobacter endophyticus]